MPDSSEVETDMMIRECVISIASSLLTQNMYEILTTYRCAGSSP
jgi:hypothetical protein